MLSAYCWPHSGTAGSAIPLCASSPFGPVHVTITRVGAAREPVARFEHVAVDDHRLPDEAVAAGCGWPVAIEIVDRTRMAVGLLRGRARTGRGLAARARAHQRVESGLLRVASHPRGRGPDVVGARHQHVARLQRLRRIEPLHGLDARIVGPAAGSRSPREAAGRGPSRCSAEPARSANGHARRLHRARAPHAMGGFGGLAELRGAVPGVGRARGIRDRPRHQRRPRAASPTCSTASR